MTSVPQRKLARYAVFTSAGSLAGCWQKKYADRHKAFVKKGEAADYQFLWVTDFPMFEYNEETRNWDAAHHPFTSPHEEDMARAGDRSRERYVHWPTTWC